MTVYRPGGKTPAVVPAEPTPASTPFIPFMGSGGGIPVSMSQFIPPNGLAGFAQQTPAVQSLYRKGRGGGGGRRRRKKKAASAVKRRVKRTAKRAAGKRLAKGSAAAKRRMAQLRKMRKR